jgi:hypothetical protein
MESAQEDSSPSLDLDASPLQGQLASAVLTLKGEMVSGKLPKIQARLLYEMLTETGSLDKPIRRLTITYSSMKYTVARDASHVYIVQSRFR